MTQRLLRPLSDNYQLSNVRGCWRLMAVSKNLFVFTLFASILLQSGNLPAVVKSVKLLLPTCFKRRHF